MTQTTPATATITATATRTPAYRATLARSLARFNGNAANLAAAISTSPASVRAWLAGTATPTARAIRAMQRLVASTPLPQRTR